MTRNNSNRAFKVMKMRKLVLFLILQILTCGYCRKKTSKVVYKPSSKYDNPNFVRDRFRIFSKSEMPEDWKSRFSQKFNPAWMDYCEPYHCNAYHKIACGLNRSAMRFKWFQSTCHLILNNECANYRGFLKYDPVEAKFCSMYVMFLRAGCPSSCVAEELEPVCGRSTLDHHLVLFINQCAVDAANCRTSSLQEYEVVPMKVCEMYLQRT